MRENDDDTPGGSDGGPLADGLGETAEPGGYSSSDEPYGDGGFDDSYDDTYGDDADGTDDTTSDDDTTADDGGSDDTASDDTTSDDGGYGDGETDGDVVDEADDADTTSADTTSDDATTDDSGGGTSFEDSDLLAEGASPLEGIGFLLDEVRDALFGDDDEGAAAGFDVDPADVASDTDLDLTGDGIVDRADLHEAESVLDFDVDPGHHGHDDGGVIDA